MIFPFSICSKVEWAFQHRFTLAKDENAYIHVYNAKDEGAAPESYKFSWTLFDNHQLVLHTRYRNFPKQHVLTMQRGRDSIKEQLLPNPIDEINGSTYLLMQFVDFDKENNFAIIETYIHDKKKRTEIEFEDPKPRQEK